MTMNEVAGGLVVVLFVVSVILLAFEFFYGD